MTDLGIHVSEAIFRNDLRRLKVLELGGIGSCLFGKTDEQLGAFQVAIMIRGDVGNEVGWVIQADGVVVNFEFHVVSPYFVERIFSFAAIKATLLKKTHL